jgi:hypothetical protein
MKSHAINCVSKQKKLAKIGIDDYGKPVVWLWCKEHRIEHVCTFASMLQSWRGMLAGDKTAMSNYLSILKKAVGDIEAEFEDMQEPNEATG